MKQTVLFMKHLNWHGEEYQDLTCPGTLQWRLVSLTAFDAKHVDHYSWSSAKA